MLMLKKNDNALDNFEPYKDEKSTSEVQNVERDHRVIKQKFRY